MVKRQLGQHRRFLGGILKSIDEKYSGYGNAQRRNEVSEHRPNQLIIELSGGVIEKPKTMLKYLFMDYK